MTINIGSTNPVKLQATKDALTQTWPNHEFEFQTVFTSSQVSNQPMSDKEAIAGAVNRAKSVIKTADFGVGLEGGLHQIGTNWFSCGWAAVVNSQEQIGLASSTRILVPTQIIELIYKGKELGEIDDIIFGVEKSNQGQGNYGLMTGGLVTRQSAYTQALICALTRFTQTDLF